MPTARLAVALLSALVLLLLGSGGAAAAEGDGPSTIFTKDEISKCGGWVSKGPNFAYDGKGRIFVVSACRGKGTLVRENALDGDEADVGIARTLNHTGHGRRLDPVGGQVIVFKSSSDGGKTWGHFQVISGDHDGYSSSKIIYDKIRGNLVVQFMRFPSGDSSKTEGATLFQRISTDGGSSWGGKRNITSVLAPCMHDGNPPSGMAGSRIQTPSGRLIFGGFGWHGARCIWYSDDGGQNYKCTGLHQERTNEWSIAVAGDTKKLILNSRAGGSDFAPYRPSYFSSDDGLSFAGPENSKWKDSVNKHGHGCEASLLGLGSKVFFFNPTGQGDSARTKMAVRCSLDGGHTLTGVAYAVRSTSMGGYSNMAPTGSQETPLLIGWGDTTNLYYERISTDWCR